MTSARTAVTGASLLLPTSVWDTNYVVMAGQKCMTMPLDAAACDHGEQMVPPVHALGSRYVGVMYRPRVAPETSTYWRVVGAADGTQLTWTPDVGGPTTLNKGQVVMFQTGTPFVVSSQDSDHPFVLGEYMTSAAHVSAAGYGDPDFVVDVPPEQYLSQYVFFADPTYPETNLSAYGSGAGARRTRRRRRVTCRTAIRAA